MPNKIIKQKSHKLAILQSHPIQYYSPLYKRLAQEENIDLTVFYCSTQGLYKYYDVEFGIDLQWDIPLLEGYKYKFIPNILGNVPPTIKNIMVQPAIFSEIIKGKYDALWTYGYKSPTYLFAIIAAKISGTMLLFRTDAYLIMEHFQNRSIKKVIRTPILKLLFAFFDGILSIGTNNKEYYKKHGVADDKIFFVPFTVDNELFMSNNYCNELEIQSIKKDLKIPGNIPVILFVGKLLQNKQPLTLLRAFCKTQNEINKPIVLVFVGEGKQKSELELYCDEHNIQNVIFSGFVNQKNISKYYTVANIFVLPSIEEHWGLVLNEAMCAKNAVIASDTVGAAVDLVRPGENGFIFPVGNVDILSKYLTKLVNDPVLCQRMGECSLDIITHWSFEEDISGIQKALSHTHRNK